MSKEIKDIPAEEMERICRDAVIAKEDIDWLNYPEDMYAAGARAEYRRHISPSSEIEIRRSTIDRLYQSILGSGQPFPGELRDIFHKAMNSLPTSPSSKPEIGLRWVKASEQLPDNPDYWLADSHEQEGKVVFARMDGQKSLGYFFRAKNSLHFSPLYYISEEGCLSPKDCPSIPIYDFSRIEWLDESIPSSEPAKESEIPRLIYDPNAGEGTVGVCGNCLNGAHAICDNEHCKCKDKGHKAWWWVAAKDEPAKKFQPRPDGEAVAFADWIIDKDYYKCVDGTWIKRGDLAEYLSTAELLDIFRENQPSSQPEPSEEKKPNCGCTDGEQCDGACYPQFDSIHIERAYCVGYINGAAANGSAIDGMADGKLKNAYILFVKSDLVPGIISHSLTPEDLAQPSLPSVKPEREEPFTVWTHEYSDKIALDSPLALRDHIAGEIYAALMAAYGRLFFGPWQTFEAGKPVGEVLLLTTSKMIVIGDWYEDGWRTPHSTWEPIPGSKFQKLKHIYGEKDVTHWMLKPQIQSPASPAIQQEDKRRGLKAFDDSMKDTLGQLPEDNPFTGNDQQEDGEVRMRPL